MGDFSEVLGSDPAGMMHIASSCTLVHILQRRIKTSNFATFVDYVLMSQNAVSALRMVVASLRIFGSGAIIKAFSWTLIQSHYLETFP
jgi:hypothetical protein